MQKRFPFPVLAILIFIIFVVQSCAAYWHLYFYFWWLDIPVHILGGAWIALFWLATYYAAGTPRKKEHSAVFVIATAVAVTLLIGLSWEIFEFAIDRGIGDLGISLGDSLKDLVDDLLGALIGGAIFLYGGYNKAGIP